MVSDECRESFRGILRDLNNPHTLGIEANEAFFLEDSIILVEGQEDVRLHFIHLFGKRFPHLEIF